MLCLSRKRDESIKVGDNVVITVIEIRSNVVRLGIEAPQDVRITRSELDAQPSKAAADGR